MGQLRSSARALLLTGAEPAMLLEDLDAVAELIPDAFCTTVFLAILDTESGEFFYSCAGHLPAVLAAPQSTPIQLDDARSVPLAVQRKASRPQSSVILPPGSTLLLYTDGLVERRDVTLDDGIARLSETVARGANLTVDAVADAALNEMAPPNGYDDDIAIVVYRRPYAPLKIDGVATAEQLRDIRHELAAWMQDAALPDERIADIVLRSTRRAPTASNTATGEARRPEFESTATTTVRECISRSPTTAHGNPRPPTRACADGDCC